MTSQDITGRFIMYGNTIEETGIDDDGIFIDLSGISHDNASKMCDEIRSSDAIMKSLILFFKDKLSEKFPTSIATRESTTWHPIGLVSYDENDYYEGIKQTFNLKHEIDGLNMKLILDKEIGQHLLFNISKWIYRVWSKGQKPSFTRSSNYYFDVDDKYQFNISMIEPSTIEFKMNVIDDNFLEKAKDIFKKSCDHIMWYFSKF